MPIVEIVCFTASDALVENISIIKESLEIIAKGDGFINLHYGLQKEDNRTAYLIIAWQSYEHHINFMNHPSYSDLIRLFEPLYTGELEPQHVQYDEDTAAVFGAPATEFVIWTKKATTSLDDLYAKIKPLREALDKEKPCHATALGRFKEREDSLSFVLGWDSVQAHFDTVKGENYKGGLIQDVLDIADLDLKHVELTKFTPKSA